MMMRTKAGYLDRTVSRLQELGHQVDRAKARVSDAQLRIEDVSAQQEQLVLELVKSRDCCKELASQVSLFVYIY